MKKRVYLFLLLFLIIFSFASIYETTYWRDAEVVAFEDDDLVVLEDEYGHVWTVQTDELKLRQNVKLTIKTNCTDNTNRDDYITQIKVIGYKIKIK